MSAASGGDAVSLVSVGSRVVRGPDWQWQDQVSNYWLNMYIIIIIDYKMIMADHQSYVFNYESLQ